MSIDKVASAISDVVQAQMQVDESHGDSNVRAIEYRDRLRKELESELSIFIDARIVAYLKNGGRPHI